MSADEFSDIVIDHFMNPRNLGMIASPNCEGYNGDPSCGDYIEIYVRIENDIIVDIGFLVYGCVGAISTGSMTMVLAKGKTVEEALNITKEDIVEALGGLPENKKHCSNLGVQALRNAIQDYYHKGKNE